MASLRRRGVLMTATASKPKASWKETSPENSGDEALEPALASQKEWEEIERQVRDEKRKLFARDNFAQGKRAKIDTYDDVASVSEGSDGEDSDDESTQSRPKSPKASAPTPNDANNNAPPNVNANVNVNAVEFDEEALRVAQAWAAGPAAIAVSNGSGGGIGGGDEEKGSKRKRGGNRDTKRLNKAEKRRLKREAEGDDEVGGSRKRDVDTAEDGEMTAGKKRRLIEKKDEEEALKWMRTKLQGEEKPRRIRVNRVVYYYDHDSAGQLFPEKLPGVDASEPVEAAVSEPAGNFRASVRQDMFDDDSDEEL